MADVRKSNVDECTCRAKLDGGLHGMWCAIRPEGEAFYFAGSGMLRTETVAHAYIGCDEFAGSAIVMMSRVDWIWLCLEHPKVADRLCPMRVESVPSVGRVRVLDMSDIAPEKSRRVWAVAVQGMEKGHAELRDMAEGKLLARIEW